MLEIYNERVQDLFVKAGNRPKEGLRVREDPKRGGTGASFLLGHAGVYAVAALVYNALGMRQNFCTPPC